MCLQESLFRTLGRFFVWVLNHLQAGPRLPGHSLYDSRASVRPWLVFSGIGGALGTSIGYLLGYKSIMANPGPWTLLILLIGAPVAWFVWYVRDKNHDRQLGIDRDELDWEIWKQVHEWATDTEKDEALRSLAIMRMRQLMMSNALPDQNWHALDRQNPLFKASQLLLKTLLRDRTRKFERVPKTVSDLPPIEQAMVTALDELRGRAPNFAGWNLSGLYFARFNFIGAKLIGTRLALSNLKGANFEKADLTDAYLLDADLTGAKFRGATLTRAKIREKWKSRIEPETKGLADWCVDVGDLLDTDTEQA